MKSVPRSNWLTICVMAALLAALGWLVRDKLLSSTHHRLSRQYIHEIAALSDRQAANFVVRLAQDDDQWLEVIVAATADVRPVVAQAAETALLELVTHWSELPADASSPRAVSLAHLLAQQAPNLPADSRHPARSLAQRLIVWPIDGRIVNAAKFIADCESVLLLPEVESSEIRVAATEPSRPIESRAVEPPPAQPPAIPAPPQVTDATVELTVPDASVPLPNEPARFAAPGAIRISDD